MAATCRCPNSRTISTVWSISSTASRSASTGHLCDREIADAYFQDYADSFWRYFRGYVEKQRKGGAATYAAAIEKYVGGGPVATSGK